MLTRPPSGHRGRGLFAVLLTVAVLSACSTKVSGPVEVLGGQSAGYAGTLLRPAPPRLDLTLANIAGGLFHLARRPQGEITALFFGYTHCPNVCPTTMADLAAAKRLLRQSVADRLRVVFVTEDPRRDTAAVLRAWLDRFDPSFVGLIGGGSTSYVLSQLHLPLTVLTPTPAPSSPGPTPSGLPIVIRLDRIGLRRGGSGGLGCGED